MPTSISTTATEGSASLEASTGAVPTGSVLTVAAVSEVAVLEAVTSTPLGSSLAVAFVLTAADDGGQKILAFNAPLTLEIRAEASAFVTQPAEARLALVRWDGAQWVSQQADVTRAGDGSVTARASASSFSLWAIMVQPEDPVFGVKRPLGGLALLAWRGIPGTPAGVASGLIDNISTMFQFDVPTQRWSSYVIGAPAGVNQNFLTTSGGVVTVRAHGTLTSAPTPTPTAPTPTPTPTNVVVPRRTVNVLPGEDLAGVAFRVNVSFGLLAALNGLTGSGYTIQPGQLLFIEEPLQQTVTVQPGEALTDVALRTNVSFDLLASLNGLTAPLYTIVPGQVLFTEAPPP